MKLSIAHPRRHIVPVVVGLLATVATSQAAVLILTPDLAQSTAAYPSTSVAGTLNDPFAYNPATPTALLPVQAWNSVNNFHANSFGGVIALTLDDTYEALFIDLYGRNSSLERDNNMTIRFYSGSWEAGDLTQEIIGFNIPDAAPYYARVTALPGTAADRFLITYAGQFLTIMELRGSGSVVPEPTAGLLLLSSAALLGLRRRRAALGKR